MTLQPTSTPVIVPSPTHLFFGMLNQYSGRSLFLPYDMTVVGSGVFLPCLRPMRNRRYIGGSGQARAGRGMSSVGDEIMGLELERLRAGTVHRFVKRCVSGQQEHQQQVNGSVQHRAMSNEGCDNGQSGTVVMMSTGRGHPDDKYLHCFYFIYFFY